MRKGCSKYSFIFVLIIIIIAFSANITYADSDSAQLDKDTPSSWAKAEIEKAIAKELPPDKILSSYRSKITREEFSEVAVNLYEALSGKKVVIQGDNPFTDTQNSKVIIANDLGIVKGVGEGKFAPKDAITRQEISVMLYRTLKAAKPGLNYSVSNQHLFEDYEMIASWAREAVAYLYSIEVVNGVGDNQFDPKGNTSREQAIVMANRMHEKASASQNGVIAARSGTSRQQNSVELELAKLIAKEMGKPYQWGGTGPDGYDCSGLVYSIYGKLDISLPRVARDQAKVGTYVAKEDLQYGDLVFFARDGKNVHHVGIYVGDGMMVHSPQTGDVVKKTTIMSGYYDRVYYTARRVID